MGRGGVRKGAGRPAGARGISPTTDRLDLAERARGYSDRVLKVLIDIAEKGKTDSARVSAANALLDRAYGRPVQPIPENTDPPENPLAAAIREINASYSRAPIATEDQMVEAEQ